MNKNQNLIISPASPEEDVVVAHHFYQLWLDNQIAPDSLDDNWLPTTLEFINQARQELSFQAFVGKIDGKIVASASCQLFAGLYPWPFKPTVRQYGYIWNVFVDSSYRRQGIGRQLTQTAIDHLRSLDCTHAILHASPYGKPLYQQLGFVDKNEMILEL